MQWLAPLALEAPEFIVAGLFAWRLQTSARARRARELEGEPVDAAGRVAADRVRDLVAPACTGCRSPGPQAGELLLTAAQSLFAVAMLVNLRMSLAEAGWIFGLFWAQFIASAWSAGEHLHEEVLFVASAVYLVAGVWILSVKRRDAARCCATVSARRTPRWSGGDVAAP